MRGSAVSYCRRIPVVVAGRAEEPTRVHSDEVISWWRDRAEQVTSLRNWTSAIARLSPDVAVSIG